MNPELTHFTSHPPPWLSLDHKLAPIFNHIRTRKIHSISQLQSERDSHPSELTPNNRTLPIFHRTLPLEPSQHAVDHPKRHLREPRRPDRKLIQTISGCRAADKITMVSLTSKVKKHLVDSIDYDGIENALYHKKERVTRF